MNLIYFCPKELFSKLRYYECEQNVKYMSNFLRSAKDEEIKGFMKNVIGLYETRKMMQPDKAFNIIGDLVSHDGRTFKIGLSNYQKKYEET